LSIYYHTKTFYIVTLIFSNFSEDVNIIFLKEGELIMMHYWGQPYMTGGWGYGFGGGLGLILTIAFWGLVIFLILMLLFKAFAKHGKHSWKDYEEGEEEKLTKGETRGALNILKERYAKGEITKKEFEEMKKVIS
jgi:putative membrane protein